MRGCKDILFNRADEVDLSRELTKLQIKDF